MSPSKRQIEEREARKQRILKGALEVFKSNGLEGSTMDQIAQQSGFGKATLYYYFKSKEDVFSAILEDGWENIWESLEPIVADEVERDLIRPYLGNYEVLLANKRLKFLVNLQEYLFGVDVISVITVILK